MQILQQNDYSLVYRQDDWVYKQQPKFLTENELWCFEQLQFSRYVPVVERVSLEQIKTKFIECHQVKNVSKFMKHLDLVLNVLEGAGIRHGDLTRYAVIVNNDRPYLVDFAESRLTCDPRPDKRPEGDRYWLEKTMKELAGIK